jgi:hypothetical protein
MPSLEEDRQNPMNRYITRIVLHGASEDDYSQLHFFMSQQGFGRLIDSDTGVWYHLPPGEYYRACDLSREIVRLQASEAASLVGLSFSVLVTPSLGSLWFGLTPYQP